MSLPDTFLTFDTVLSFGGATTATIIVTNGLGKAFEWRQSWLGLLVAEVVLVGGALLTTAPSVQIIIIAVLNGFLVFLSASGLNEAAVARNGFQAQSLPIDTSQPFFQSWFWRKRK
jgi:hypothetical protein